MIILFVVRGIGYSGAGKQLVMTANGMARSGHDVYIYVYKGRTCEQQLDKNVKLIFEDNPPVNTLIEYLFTPFRLKKLIKDVRAEIVVGWRTNAGCAAVLATRRSNVRCVFSERSDPYLETSTKLKLAKFVCDHADGGVFQTDGALRYYKRLQKKSVVIPNPIDDIEEFPDIVDWDKRNNEIVCVGRFFNKQKRFDILLKAFRIVHNHNPNLKLKVYGDGVDRQKIKHFVNELDLNESVCFAGVTNNVIDSIKKAKVLVLSSDYEGIPNVILEAFISGVPVVTTDTSPGGARVLIENGKNGFVVPIRDYHALADKICELLSCESLSEKFIRMSRNKLNEFKPNRIFEAWNDYFSSFFFQH